MNHTLRLIVLAASLLTVAACDRSSLKQDQSRDSAKFQKQLMTQLLKASPGDVITIPEGRFEINRSLSLKVSGVTIRGQGMDKSILSFANQITGAEGLLVTASDFVIEDLAIEDTKGDALKINEGRNIVIRRVRTEWTDGPKTSNGAYGIYPVQTENTLIDGAVAIGASDAGIYVGQSRNVIVRNSKAAYNVAGIEIENTVDADVYDNLAVNNTGGILVFNMPNLPQEGSRTRVFNNRIGYNNTANFAEAGGAVAGVPAGSGVVINSNDHIEIFANEFADNQTAHILISSVFSTNYATRDSASSFDPYPESIFIHDNLYTGGGEAPGTPELKTLKDAIFGAAGSFPHIIWDGYTNEALLVDGKLPAEKNICVSNEDSGLLNIDSPNKFANPRMQTELHQCEHKPLSAIELALK